MLSDARSLNKAILRSQYAWQRSFVCFIPRCTLLNVSCAFNCALYICRVSHTAPGRMKCDKVTSWVGLKLFKVNLIYEILKIGSIDLLHFEWKIIFQFSSQGLIEILINKTEK